MIKQKVFIGFVMGLLSTVIGASLCTFIISKVKHGGFSETFISFQNDEKLWMLLALGAIPNLLLFFFLLRKDLEYKARGVVLATLLIAFITYSLYFL
ncbi:hypothetical protein [Pseudofulvibacter geojedonensis]|uniref:Uncharacterized protein n=1 Tax=Pseudofulvibacter geojedonensis TaxID=1123758 RepID=A0ABW3I372_9FLAO